MVLTNETAYRLKVSVFEKGKLYVTVDIPKGGQVSKLIGDGGQSYFTNTFIDSAVLESGSKTLIQYCNGEILIYGNKTPTCKGLPNNLPLRIHE